MDLINAAIVIIVIVLFYYIMITWGVEPECNSVNNLDVPTSPTTEHLTEQIQHRIIEPPGFDQVLENLNTVTAKLTDDEINDTLNENLGFKSNNVDFLHNEGQRINVHIDPVDTSRDLLINNSDIDGKVIKAHLARNIHINQNPYKPSRDSRIAQIMRAPITAPMLRDDPALIALEKQALEEKYEQIYM